MNTLLTRLPKYLRRFGLVDGLQPGFEIERGQPTGRAPVIVDCAANVGLSAPWFARRFPKATIVAAEPDGQNFETLRANTPRLGDQVRRMRGGVWSESTTLKTVNPGSGSLDEWFMPWAGTSRSFFACLCRHPFEYLLGRESIFCFRDASA